MPSKKKPARKAKPRTSEPRHVGTMRDCPHPACAKARERAARAASSKPRTVKRSAVSGRYTKGGDARETVTETQPKAIGAGWVPVFEGRAYSGFFDGRVCVYEAKGGLDDVYPALASAVSVQYVRLIPAAPPKARRRDD